MESTLTTITQPPFVADTLAEIEANTSIIPDGSMAYARDTMMMYRLVSSVWSPVKFDADDDINYANGVPITPTVHAFFSGSIQSGSIVFALVDGSGNAMCSSIAKINIRINDSTQMLLPKSTVSDDKKTIKINVTKQTFSKTNVLTSLLGALGLVVSDVTYPDAPNGTQVEVEVWGY